MLSFLRGPVLGVVKLTFLLSVILLVSLSIIIAGVLKYLLPFSKAKKLLTAFQNDISPSIWIDINNLVLARRIEWEIHGKGELHYDHWYFMFANHRSWVDIFVLQKVFNRKIRLLKFFMKRELLWGLPFGGVACWMLDFPLLKRHSKSAIKKNRQLMYKDLEATQEACRKFRQRPTAIINFLEGTRFTPKKQQERSSPYKHLLRPKAGGFALVLNELKDYIHEAIDTTIIYSLENPSFWDLLCGRIRKVTLYYEVVPLEQEMYGDYYKNVAFRRRFHSWINDRWHEKEKVIAAVLAGGKSEQAQPTAEFNASGA